MSALGTQDLNAAQDAPPSGARIERDVLPVLKRLWGFEVLRPLQADSIMATLGGRDSLTVLPTGGGKSLCYQLPPVVTGRLTLVVSPLIALMRDQVAGLRLAGVEAAAVYGAMGADEFAEVRAGVLNGRIKLLFVAPERLLAPAFMSLVVKANPGHIAVDEAHCISQWGHDFRPEYRRLRELREALPGVAVGAYTATATQRVREDIVKQLGLKRAAVLVGDFDRPNLTYRILPRVDVVKQTVEVIKRCGTDEAAIVYCISRKKTEELAGALRSKGLHAAAYHAGMEARERARVSDDFKGERLSVVVATVAFGMGIDRSDVRAVIHAAMPRTVEAYQQETGRAGRDGLPAECVMLYSSADAVAWRGLMERSAREAEGPVAPEFLQGQYELLDRMQNLAAGARCRHRALCEYFDQAYVGGAGGVGSGGGVGGACGACDVCLKELRPVADGHETARKIISCVARLARSGPGRVDGNGDARGMSYGAGHIVNVLRGARDRMTLERGHDQLSTYGLLREVPAPTLTSYVNQLVDAGALVRAAGEYPTIMLGMSAMKVLKNEVTAELVEPREALEPAAGRSARRTRTAASGRALTGEEGRLFEELRALRRALAEERSVPPFVIASDAVLEELCRVRPTSAGRITEVKGIGTKKAADFGAKIAEVIAAFCKDSGMAGDQGSGRALARGDGDGFEGELGGGSARVSGGVAKPSAARAASVQRRVATDDGAREMSVGAMGAAEFFREGMSIDAVMGKTGRARSTVENYLCEFLVAERPAALTAWVSDAARRRVSAAVEEIGSGSLRELKEHLAAQGGEEIAYDAIKAVMAWEGLG
ncbi:DNA helicase RecQ [soil metagenome]